MPEGVPRSTIPSFSLPLGTFDAVAAGRIAPATVELLVRSERSRRLLLVHHLLTCCADEPSLLAPLGGPEAVRGFLRDVQERQRDAWEETLSYPQTGMWLSHTVRVLREVVVTQDPPWAHVGGLATLAATAALRARMPFRTRVPIVRGQIMFSGLGLLTVDATADGAAMAGGAATAAEPADPVPAYAVAVVQGTAEHLEVRLGQRRIEVPFPLDRDLPGWAHVPLLTVTATSGRELRTRLDHVDPAPARVGLPAPAPSAEVIANWRGGLAEAWQLLDADHPDEARTLSAGLRAVVPLRSNGTVLSGTSGDGFGSASVLLPLTATDLACALLHEVRHSLLNGLLHLVELAGTDPRGAVYYAPWRDDPRPLVGMLHGAYAFTAVTAFWRARRTADRGPAARRAELEFAHWRLQTRLVLDELSGSPLLTTWGHRLVHLLRDQIRAWTLEPVPPGTARLALTTSRSHRAAWRAHHVSNPPSWTADVVRRWRAGERAPGSPDETVERDPTACCLNRVFLLARLDHLGSAGPLPHLDEQAVAGDPHGADRCLARGDIAEARDRYLAEIRADPDDPHPWGGLGTALAGTRTSLREHPAGVRLLVERPERVRAAYRHLSTRLAEPPDVVRLAAWLADAS